MRTSAQKIAMDRWIEDTQMFQRIAGVSVTAREDLERDWQEMQPRTRTFESQRAAEHRIIQDMAVRAGRARRS